MIGEAMTWERALFAVALGCALFLAFFHAVPIVRWSWACIMLGVSWVRLRLVIMRALWRASDVGEVEEQAKRAMIERIRKEGGVIVEPAKGGGGYEVIEEDEAAKRIDEISMPVLYVDKEGEAAVREHQRGIGRVP